MKVLLLANHFNTGGISTYILTLAEGYMRRGHEVFIATSGGDRVEDALALGARHRTVAPLRVKCECHPLLLGAALDIAAFVKNNDIDILHPQTRVTQVVAALAGAWSRRPYVSTCHGFFTPRFSRRILPFWGKAAVAISQPVAAHMTGALRVPAEDLVLVPNGVDARKFKPALPDEVRALREEFCVGVAPLVGIIARLSDVKGHCYLIEAMGDLVHSVLGVKCLIIGAGPLEEALKQQVQEAGLEASVLFSRINGRPAGLMPMFDVFVMPSLQEGLGLSAMEAQACGVPVVASKVGGLVEAVEDGVTGFLVPPRDPSALAGALLKLLTDRTMAQRFGAAGRQRIEAKFSVDGMVDGTLDVYRKVLGHA